jgi:nicotinate-nucleotide adenylyltransferase
MESTKGAIVMIDLIEIEQSVSGILDDYRMAHTRSVKGECLRLAELFGMSEEDTNLLAMAALLHDCTKPLDPTGHRVYAQLLGVNLSEDDLSSPAVLHSITGAAIAEKHFDAPPAVVSAIACHTTGKEDMTLIEKLLFLADYIEPTRKFDDCLQVRRYFYEDSAYLSLPDRLDTTLILAFDLTISQLLSEHRPIHPTTVKSRNFLLKKS